MAVQFRRPIVTICALTPRYHGPAIPQACIRVSPLTQCDFAIVVSILAFRILIESLTGLLSPTLVLNVLYELFFFFVSLLAKSQSGHNDYDFMDEIILRQYVVCTHVLDTEVALLVHKHPLPFSRNLECGKEKAVNNTIKGNNDKSHLGTYLADDQ
jgi:hypothetical protein